MRFIPETEAQAIRAHLHKKLEGPVTLDLFIEPKSAISESELARETGVSRVPTLVIARSGSWRSGGTS